jgi:dipeptidase D
MEAKIIEGLKPKILWQRFYEISQVPRPSKKEGKILEYLKKLLTQLNISYEQDNAGNIVAFVPPSSGYENSPKVVLQGHVDMVCEKNKSTNHDFENDPIKLKLENGWMRAEGTTLGSDNGIGIAAALAVITDKDVIHGPIEILLTVDEETGLTGANSLQPGFINGKILINMDSEEDGAFYVGCAGGVDTVGVFRLDYEDAPEGYELYELMVTGLRGGHSGLDINQGRGNAIKILARALKAIEKMNYKAAKIEGGSLRNAIPREAEAIVYLTKEDYQKAVEIIKSLEAAISNELHFTDNGVTVKLNKVDSQIQKTIKRELTDKIINALLALPNGVVSMSQNIPGLVETSTNLATIKMNSEIRIGTSQRSSIESSKRYIAQSVAAVFKLAGAKVEVGDGYPGWKPNLDSEILSISKNVFKSLFNKEPEIKAIHAGLECGILGDKNPGLDMVSFGPTIESAHSPDERVNIETVEKFYELLKGILKNLAEEKYY